MSSSTTYSEISESSSSVDPDDAGNDDYTNLDSDGSDDNNDINDNDNGSGSGSIEPDAGAGSKSALATADAALATAQIQVSDGDCDVVDADAGGDVYIELLPAPTSSVESDADDADGDGAGHDVYIEVLPASTTASTKAPTKASKPLALAPQKLESSTLSSEKEGKVFNEDYLKARQLLIEIQTSMTVFFCKASSKLETSRSLLVSFLQTKSFDKTPPIAYPGYFSLVVNVALSISAHSSSSIVSSNHCLEFSTPLVIKYLSNLFTILIKFSSFTAIKI